MLLRPALLLLALAASSPAWGEALDATARVARLSYVEGQVAFRGAADEAPASLPDRPLMAGDRLTTEHGGRAELTLGTAAVRLDELTDLTIVTLDATTVWVELDAGTASVVLHELFEDEIFEFVTPITALSLQGPGEYRVDVSADGATAITVQSGTAELATAGGPVRITDSQRVWLEGRDALASLTGPLPADAFDDWVLSRERELDDAESRYAMRDGDGYDELDRYGEWYDEPRYGRVWKPSYAYGGWDPFRLGHWEHIGAHRRTWIDPSPWSSLTFHRGRWAFLHDLNRWCWVPGPRAHSRHFAQDTKPFGRPRGNAQSRNNDRRDPPRDVDRRTRDKDVRQPVSASAWTRPQVGIEPRKTTKGKVAAAKWSQPANAVRSFGSNQSQPKKPATASKGGGTTMRSSNNVSAARKQATSGSTPKSNRTFGASPIP